jgi:protein SCO1
MRNARPIRRLALPSAIFLVAAACTSGNSAATGTPAPTVTPPAATSPETTAAPESAPSASAAAAAALTATLGDPRPAPPLVGLVNPDGSAFELADHAGSPTLVFFGYTHCPDVCPATIGELFGVFKAAPQAQAVFVSVDPERDTPEFLAKWTAYMPENFHAVTGSPGAIRRAADEYGVKYARVETTSTAGYTMSHSADVFLIDGDGQLLLSYPFGTPAADIVADISTL